jgi:hypothetical protein
MARKAKGQSYMDQVEYLYPEYKKNITAIRDMRNVVFRVYGKAVKFIPTFVPVNVQDNSSDTVTQ